MVLNFSVSVVLLLLSSVSCIEQNCQILSQNTTEVKCDDLKLSNFPDFHEYKATLYNLNGNSFSHVSDNTFPPGMAVEINIMRNDRIMYVDSNAFRHVANSLRVLRLQNLEFQFDGVFEPVKNLSALNHLEIGSETYSRNLSEPFLDAETMNQLIWLRVVFSGIENIAPEVLDSEFQHLRHLSLRGNKLQVIPEGIKRVMRLRSHNVLEIDLSHNSLETLQRKWFPADCKVTSLDLSHNNIGSIQIRAFDHCLRLNKLNLQGNKELQYLSPTLFFNNCHQAPRMEVNVQDTSIQNVEFALRSCVERVFYWNTKVACTCRHKSLIQCSQRRDFVLFGDCLWHDGERLYTSKASLMWEQEGCDFDHLSDAYSPEVIDNAGDPLASLKDWGECVIEKPSSTSSVVQSKTATSPEPMQESFSSTAKQAPINESTRSHSNMYSGSKQDATYIIQPQYATLEATDSIETLIQKHIYIDQRYILNGDTEKDIAKDEQSAKDLDMQPNRYSDPSSNHDANATSQTPSSGTQVKKDSLVEHPEETIHKTVSSSASRFQKVRIFSLLFGLVSAFGLGSANFFPLS